MSAGKINQVRINDVSVGRRLMCNEDPKTRATSGCAKKLAQTVSAAKRGLTAAQVELWRRLVFTAAVLQARRYCTAYNEAGNRAAEPTLTRKQLYKKCIEGVLSGSMQFTGMYGVRYKWSWYLINGAAIVKRINPFKTRPPGGNSVFTIQPPGGSATTPRVNKSTPKRNFVRIPGGEDEPESGGNPARSNSQVHIQKKTNPAD